MSIEISTVGAGLECNIVIISGKSRKGQVSTFDKKTLFSNRSIFSSVLCLFQVLFILNRLHDCATAASPAPDCAPIVLGLSALWLRQRYSLTL
jgi:hypothetical protein